MYWELTKSQKRKGRKHRMECFQKDAFTLTMTPERGPRGDSLTRRPSLHCLLSQAPAQFDLQILPLGLNRNGVVDNRGCQASFNPMTILCVYTQLLRELHCRGAETQRNSPRQYRKSVCFARRRRKQLQKQRAASSPCQQQ